MQVRTFSPTNNYARQQTFESRFEDSADLSSLKANMTADENEELDQYIQTIENDGRNYIYRYKEIKRLPDGHPTGLILRGYGNDNDHWDYWASGEVGLDAFRSSAKATKEYLEQCERERISKRRTKIRTAAISTMASLMLMGGIATKRHHDEVSERERVRVECMSEIRNYLNGAHSSPYSIDGVNRSHDEHDATEEMVNFYDVVTEDLPLGYKLDSMHKLIDTELENCTSRWSHDGQTDSWWEVEISQREIRQHKKDLNELDGFSNLNKEQKVIAAQKLVDIRKTLNNAHTDFSSDEGRIRTSDEEFIKESITHTYLKVLKSVKSNAMFKGINSLLDSELRICTALDGGQGAGISWNEHWRLSDELEDHAELLNSIQNDNEMSKEEKDALIRDITNSRIYLNDANSSPCSYGGTNRTDDENYMTQKLLEHTRKTLKDLHMGEKRQSMVTLINCVQDKYTDPVSEGGRSYSWKEFQQMQDDVENHKKDLMKNDN